MSLAFVTSGLQSASFKKHQFRPPVLEPMMTSGKNLDSFCSKWFLLFLKSDSSFTRMTSDGTVPRRAFDVSRIFLVVLMVEPQCHARIFSSRSFSHMPRCHSSSFSNGVACVARIAPQWFVSALGPWLSQTVTNPICSGIKITRPLTRTHTHRHTLCRGRAGFKKKSGSRKKNPDQKKIRLKKNIV